MTGFTVLVPDPGCLSLEVWGWLIFLLSSLIILSNVTSSYTCQRSLISQLPKIWLEFNSTQYRLDVESRISVQGPPLTPY